MSRQYIEEAWNLLKEEPKEAATSEPLIEREINQLPHDLYHEYFGSTEPRLFDEEGNILTVAQIAGLPAATYYINTILSPEVSENTDRFVGIKFENFKVDIPPIFDWDPDPLILEHLEYGLVSGDAKSFVAIPEKTKETPKKLVQNMININGDDYHLSFAVAGWELLKNLRKAIAEIPVPLSVELEVKEKIQQAKNKN